MRHVYNPLLDTFLYWIVNLWKGQCHGKCSKGSEKNGDLKLGPWAMGLMSDTVNQKVGQVNIKDSIQAFVCPKSLSPWFQGPKISQNHWVAFEILSSSRDWGGVLDFGDIPHLLPCHVLISPRAIVLWFLQRDVGATKRYLRVMGRNDKLRRLPRQREAPPERWETAFRRFAKGAPWQIGVFLLKQQTSQKMTCDRCIVSDWMSKVALHIGQIHDSTFRMIQNSSNLYKRRIVLREFLVGWNMGPKPRGIDFFYKQIFYWSIIMWGSVLVVKMMG